MVSYNPTPLFLFYLVTSTGESWYVDNDGAVQKRGLPTPLVYSPDGWQEMSIGWERNLDKLGLVRNFSLSLGFPGDGAVILEHIFNRYNIDEKVSLMVQKLDLEVTVDDYAPVYKFYYRGSIDLSSYRKEPRKVLVNIMEGGRSADLKANEATDYDFSLEDDPDKIRVKFDGMNLQNQALYALTNGLPTADPFWNFKNHLVELEIIRKEVDDIGTAKFQDRTQVSNSNSQIRGTGGWFFKATVAGTVKIDWSDIAVLIEYDPAAPGINPAAQVKVVVRRIDENNFSNFQLELLSTGTGNAVPGNYALNGTGNITVSPGDELYLYAFCNVEGATGDAQLRFTYSGTAPIFKASYTFKFPETFVYMLRPDIAFKRLVGRIAGSEDYAVSDLLASCDICITSMDGLRGLDGARWKTSLARFFETYKILKMAGLGVEGENIILEALDHFLNDANVIDIGEVQSTPKIEPAIELMANTIKAGYNDVLIEDINGKYAFNVAVDYSSPLKRVTRQLDLQVPYIGDPFFIEIKRANLDGKTTTDDRQDSEIILAVIDLDNPQVDADGTYYNLKRPVFTTITGVPDQETVFNIPISPARILRIWKRWLRSIYWKFDSGLIKYEGASPGKNRDLATTGGPDPDITESADLTIGSADLGDPLFEPKKLTVVAPSAPSMVTVLAATPAAIVRFTRNALPYKGFILKCSMASKTAQEQEYILLSHPDNDLKLLENGG